MIPRRLVRTVPEKRDPHVEELWDVATALHPGWQHVTWRDPVDTSMFPITSPYWADCETGAQLADLIRAEDLFHRGGWYIDSDMWMLKPLNDLCPLGAVAAWEDTNYVPNAVLGFTAHHPALERVLELAVERRFCGTWNAGVGVTTEVFTSRRDVVLLPPSVFYPVHWRESHRGGVSWIAAAEANPWCYGIHKYAASWH